MGHCDGDTMVMTLGVVALGGGGGTGTHWVGGTGALCDGDTMMVALGLLALGW